MPARTVLAIQQLRALNQAAPTPGQLDITFTAADVANGNAFPFSGREVLLVQNADGAAAHHFTVSSVADGLGRTGDITAYTVALSGFSAIDANTLQGWLEGDGNIYLSGDNASIKFAVLRHS